MYMPFGKLINKHKNNNGFTVIELLIVIAIIAILGTVSMGPMLRWRANAKVESNTNNIMADLERAKVEAIRRSRNITIIFPAINPPGSTGGYSCFLDVNGNGSFDSADDKILFERVTNELFELNLVIKDDSSVTNYFTFTPRGFLNGTRSGEITITYPNSTASLERQININRIGNISSKVK